MGGNILRITGREFEKDSLLSPEQQKKYDDSEGGHQKLRKKGMPLQAALRDAIYNNPFLKTEEESHNPVASWLNDVHAAAAEKLGIGDYAMLRVFPAVGTALDLHGIDVLFVYLDPISNKPVIVTADLTTAPNKVISGMTADMLITPLGAAPSIKLAERGIQGVAVPERGKKNERTKRREAIGEMIAEIIQNKLQQGDPTYTTQATRLRLERLLGRKAVAAEAGPSHTFL